MLAIKLTRVRPQPHLIEGLLMAVFRCSKAVLTAWQVKKSIGCFGLLGLLRLGLLLLMHGSLFLDLGHLKGSTYSASGSGSPVIFPDRS